jgi:hypothetical protein
LIHIRKVKATRAKGHFVQSKQVFEEAAFTRPSKLPIKCRNYPCFVVCKCAPRRFSLLISIHALVLFSLKPSINSCEIVSSICSIRRRRVQPEECVRPKELQQREGFTTGVPKVGWWELSRERWAISDWNLRWVSNGSMVCRFVTHWI